MHGSPGEGKENLKKRIGSPHTKLQIYYYPTEKLH